MRRIAFSLFACLIIIALAYQVFIINSAHAGFSESKIISLAFISEFILFFAAIILLHQNYHYKQKMLNMHEENQNFIQETHDAQSVSENLFEHTNTAVIMLELNGKISRVNRAFFPLLGYGDGKKLPNLNYFNLIEPKDLSDLQTHLQDLIDNEIQYYQCEQQCLKKNGERVWTISTFSVIRDQKHKPKNFIIQLENITLQKRAEERLQHLAYHDPLTGLANRNKLKQFINHVIATSRRQQTGFALMFLDLDRFKNVNDSIGHEAGDMLLQIVSERLKNLVRSSDLVARLGGDEFIILITNVKKAESAAIIAKKVLDSILNVISINQQEIYITTSVGISLYPNDGQTIQTLMKHADLALYRAKERGRNNYEFYNSEMTLHAQEKLALQNALCHALAKDEFRLHFQPKLNIKTKKITGIEAFLRWQNKEFGAISPDQIIQLAEETGLIIPVSDWIMETAVQQLKYWHNLGYESLTMAVNCSARQLKNSTFVDDVMRILNKANLSPKFLELEITESIIMSDPENILHVLFSLKDLGVKIVIDDFGTGYWSLSNLRQLRIDQIKIDKTFIKNATKDETSSTIISAILAMAKKIGSVTVAEGVETHQQYAYLEKEGCDEIQGYYLTKPLTEDVMTYFLAHPTLDSELINKHEVSS